MFKLNLQYFWKKIETQCPVHILKLVYIQNGKLQCNKVNLSVFVFSSSDSTDRLLPPLLSIIGILSFTFCPLGIVGCVFYKKGMKTRGHCYCCPSPCRENAARFITSRLGKRATSSTGKVEHI